MKKIHYVLTIIIFAVLIQGFSFERGEDYSMMGDDSLSIAFDNDVFGAFTVYPDSEGRIHFDVPDTVRAVAVYSFPRKLNRVYAVIDNDTDMGSIWAIMGDIFYDSGITDSALFYFEKAMDAGGAVNDAYKGLLDIAGDKGTDSLIFYMNEYSARYSGSKTVIFENAMRYRKMDNDSMYSVLLRKGIEGTDSSASYLMLLVYSVYDDIEPGKEELLFALKNFRNNENLSYIIDYIESSGMFNDMINEIEPLLGDNVHAENRLSTALLMLDEHYRMKQAYAVLSSLIEADAFPDYTGYLYYKLASADVYSGDFDKARLNFSKALENDTYRDKEFYTVKFSMDSFFNDSQSMLSSAMNVIAMDYTDSTLFHRMGQYSAYADKSGQSMLIRILEDEMEDMPSLDFTLTRINEDTVLLNATEGILFIDCFTSWCSYCKKAMPLVLEMKSELPQLNIIGMSSEKNSNDLIEYVRASDIDFPVLYNGGDFYSSFSVRGVPNMLLIDTGREKMFRLVGYSISLKEYFILRYRYLAGEL